MTAPLAGLGLVEDAFQVAEGILGGSWVDASLGGVGVSLEALSLVLDPIGGLVSWGVGWLMEHVEPLREALDELAGDAGAVAGQAAAWRGVAASVEAARVEYAEQVRGVGGWVGAAGDAYRVHAGENLAVLQGVGVAAGGIAAAVEGAGLLVALVREIVRDLIADFVATLAVRLPQWLAMEGFSLGIATPVVVSQVGSLVSSWVDRIQHFIRGLLSSLRRLLPMTDWLRKVLEGLREAAARIARSLPTGGRMDASADRPRPHGGDQSAHEPGGGAALPPPGPPWRGRDDIAGPARGRDLTLPHDRHTLSGVKHGKIRGENSMILRGYEGAVRDDIRQIAAGNATWMEDIGRYDINGRLYCVKPTGQVFPASGEGIAPLDRNEYAALKEIARAGGDVDQVKVFERDPRFLNNPELISKAKSIYDGTYPP